MPDEIKLGKMGETSTPVSAKPVKFLHREGAHVPTFSADGAWGTLNPLNLIRIGFYTENPQTPQAVVQPVDLDGSPKGDQIEVGSIDENYYVMCRDFQCNVILTLPSAAQLYQMLGNFIRASQQQMKEQSETMRIQMQEAIDKKSQQQIK